MARTGAAHRTSAMRRSCRDIGILRFGWMPAILLRDLDGRAELRGVLCKTERGIVRGVRHGCGHPRSWKRSLPREGKTSRPIGRGGAEVVLPFTESASVAFVVRV